MLILIGIWFIIFVFIALPITTYIRRWQNQNTYEKFYLDSLFWKIIYVLILISLLTEIIFKVIR